MTWPVPMPSVVTYLVLIEYSTLHCQIERVDDVPDPPIENIQTNMLVVLVSYRQKSNYTCVIKGLSVSSVKGSSTVDNEAGQKWRSVSTHAYL